MKVIIQIFEVAIGLTISLFLINAFIPVLNADFFNYLRQVFVNFSNLFGNITTSSIITIFIGLFMVYAGRWIFSRASNNGGDTPNNK